MTVSVFIPTALRKYAQGKSEIQIDASDVGETLVLLGVLYPEVRNYIFDNDKKLKRFVNVFVNETNIKNLDGLQTRLEEGANIALIPAIAGGNDE